MQFIIVLPTTQATCRLLCKLDNIWILEKVTRFTGFRMGSPSLSTVCSSPKHFTLEEFYSFSYYLYAGGWIFLILCPYFDSPLRYPLRYDLLPQKLSNLQAPQHRPLPHNSRPIPFLRTSAHKANLHHPFLGNPFGMSHKYVWRYCALINLFVTYSKLNIISAFNWNLLRIPSSIS